MTMMGATAAPRQTAAAATTASFAPTSPTSLRVDSSARAPPGCPCRRLFREGSISWERHRERDEDRRFETTAITTEAAIDAEGNCSSLRRP
mmetsp:Transcript_6665/g.13362  ORF Transcript_6665/g.13362 Transcript_6665/m.13362 type:complete len:91 (+) Transcript_6665:204-476(+)